MRCRACQFSTERLFVKEWHSLSPDEWQENDLAGVVCAILTEAVTSSLPPSWRGPYTEARARAWIRERDQEATALLAVERSTGRPVGLVILFETEGAGGIDVRLGYLLAESAWGRGFATELVQGLVEWCRAQGEIVSLIGGVARDNAASIRVLQKCGFRATSGDGEELTFRVGLRE